MIFPIKLTFILFSSPLRAEEAVRDESPVRVSQHSQSLVIPEDGLHDRLARHHLRQKSAAHQRKILPIPHRPERRHFRWVENYAKFNYYVLIISILGLVSSKLEQVIDVQINFGDGFGAAPRSFKIVKTIGDVKEETVRKIVNGVVPGPEYAKDVAHLLELYFRDKEKKMEKLRK